MPGGKLECGLCPHACVIPDGRTGRCRVRGNTGGSLSLPFYAYISALAVDPVEKKPLYHFRPGSLVFSAGFTGCNLRCPFCQNWRISQRVPPSSGDGRVIGAEELVALALESGSGQIAYTYSEPLVHAEYLLESMALAREKGLANILVTNGTVSSGTAKAVLALCDAVNVDLKSFSPQTYAKTLGGDLDAVLAFITEAHALGVHIELTTLVVTGLNDRPDELESIASFIAGVSPSIPWHLSAYHPDYRWDAPPTDPGLLVRAARAGKKRLAFVYTGNTAGGDFSDTACPRCGKTLVRRRAYRVDCSALAVRGKAGYCASCGGDAGFIRL